MRPRALLILPLLVVGAGCDGGPKRVPVYPVRGSMTFDKKPPAGAMIVFHPLSGDAFGTDLRPSAIVQTDGAFAPTTYDHGDGLPAGEYALTVYWPVPPGRNGEDDGGGMSASRLPPRYDKPDKSGLKIVVERQPNELRAISLTR